MDITSLSFSLSFIILTFDNPSKRFLVTLFKYYRNKYGSV